MSYQPVKKVIASLSVLVVSMGESLANTQLDQLEALLAKQREQQAQLAQLLKQTQAEVGGGPVLGLPSLPEITMQSALLSGGALAAVLLCGAMLWLWKNRMPSSVAYRPTPEPYFKESAYTDSALTGLDTQGTSGKNSAFKTSTFKKSDYQDSSIKDSAASPVGFNLPLQDSSWTEPWATATIPQANPAAAPAAESVEAVFSSDIQPDISLDDLESGFGAPDMDFDLSDFDTIDSPEIPAHDAFSAATGAASNMYADKAPEVSFADITVPVPPSQAAQVTLAPLTVADFDLTPLSQDSDDFTDSTAVFIAGEVDHRESAFDLLKFNPNDSAVKPAAATAPAAALPRLRASTKIDSEVPSKYNELAAEPLRPAVAYVATVASKTSFKPPSEDEVDSGFTGSAFGQLQLNAPPEILPYPHDLTDDDATFATQLQLARECAEIGQIDEAELLCQEVFTNGTEPMREYALYILTRLPEFKRK